jgi:hypothetical protein
VTSSLAVQEFFESALRLSDEDRQELLYLLAGSCADPDPDWWDEVEPEMEARIAALDAGEVAPLSLQEVRKWLFERVSATAD